MEEWINIKAIKFKRISWKLTLIYAAMFSLVLIALSVAVVYGIRYYLTDHAFVQVQDSSSITAKNIIDILNERGSLTDPELLNEAAGNSGIIITIADRNGNIVNSSAGRDMYHINITSFLDNTRKIETGDSHLVFLNTKITFNGELFAYLQVIKNMETEYSFLKAVVIILGIADIAGVFFSLLIGYFIGRRMLRPIDKITETAKEISISDLNRKIEVRGNDDELDRLAKTFNDMIDRLRLSFEQQNNFVADASHELRTPIAVIRGYIDLVDRWGKNDPKVLEEAIASIKNETIDMGNMVERLLFLARSDIGKLVVRKEPFDLYDLAEEVSEEYGLIYQEKLIKIEISKGTQLSADREMMKQALRAVIDNAIKYSTEKRKIRIFCSSSRNETAISVQDFGVGIPKAELKKIFERFYRVDTSRERKTGGVGLGLSIIKTIVTVHGGRIEIESEPGKGTILTMTLPNK